MNITPTQHRDVTVLCIEGSVDSLTAESLTEALSRQMDDGGVRLVADFAGVEYTSSAGLRSLLGALKQSRRAGGDLRMAAVRPAVLRVLSLSGFSAIIKIYDDVESAVASFAPES